MTKPVTPPRVKDCDVYWTQPPPDPSPRLAFWVDKIRAGWKPNKRVRQMGWMDAAPWFGVYTWEYLNILRPMIALDGLLTTPSDPKTD